MVSGRTPSFTAIAKVLNVLGLAYVTLPVRIALAGSWPCAAGGGTWPPSPPP